MGEETETQMKTNLAKNPSASDKVRTKTGLSEFCLVLFLSHHSDDGGVSCVSSDCGAHGGFLTRHDEYLREPLVRCQGTHVSMRMARDLPLRFFKTALEE